MQRNEFRKNETVNSVLNSVRDVFSRISIASSFAYGLPLKKTVYANIW